MLEVMCANIFINGIEYFYFPHLHILFRITWSFQQIKAEVLTSVIKHLHLLPTKIDKSRKRAINLCWCRLGESRITSEYKLKTILKE